VTTPLWSYRVPLEQRPLLKRIADALKRDPMLASALEAALERRSDAAARVGPFADEEAALGFIRDRLVFSLRPESLWLFGSRARGEHRPDSDFDILAVLADELGAKARDYRYVLEPVLGSGLPCDIVPCPLSEFDQAKDVLGTIALVAFLRGRQLYQKRRPPAATAAA
jgi:predicted nucleotidyltransferase